MRRVLLLVLLALLAVPAAGQVVVNGVPTAPSYGVLVNGVPAGTKPSATLVVAASNSRSSAGADYVCDGTADEVQINAAIAALPAGGGTVQILDGLYSINAAIVMKSGTWLRGVGYGTTVQIVAAHAGSIDMIAARANGANEHLVISDLVLDANAAPTVQGIYVSTSPNGTLADDVRIERCLIKGGSGTSYGVMSFGASNLLIQDNIVQDWGDSTLELKASHRVRVARNSIIRGSLQLYAQVDGAGAAPNDYSILGNTFLDSNVVLTNASSVIQDFVFANNTWTKTSAVAANCDVTVRVVNNASIVGNTFDSSLDTTYTTPMVILESTATNVVFQGNILRTGTGSSGAYGYDAMTLAAPGAIIADNVFVVPGDYNEGIKAETASTGTIIRGNRIIGNSGVNTGCITLAATANVQVVGNTCDTCGGTGISVAVTSSGTRVFDNRFLGTVALPYSLLDVSTMFRSPDGLAFAALPADVADGSTVYCTDCTIASPCADSGTGAIAKRLANAWVCN